MSDKKLEICNALNKLADDVHANARAKGFWPDDRNLGEAVALIHSECSELLEYLRAREPLPSDHIFGMSGVEEELADIIIRTLDLAAGMGVNIGSAVLSKHEYNKSRGRKHGKQF